MNIESIKKFVLNKEVWGHLALWTLLFSGLNVGWTYNWIHRTDNTPGVLGFAAVYFVLFFYANSLWLLPRFFKRKTWYQYLLMLGLVVAIPEGLRALIIAVSYTQSDDLWMVVWRQFFSRDSLVFGVPSAVWVGFFSSSAYYFIKNWLVSGRKIEQLEMEKVTMELNLLKSQINPHFLFNNLNALDDLIDRDKQMAKEYLHRLSKILRYSISSMENDVVTLKDEWQAVDDYIYLIEERFGETYRFDKIIEIENLEDYLIPPASLQSLVENVVKHNQGSVHEPLVTTIRLSNAGLSVSNPKRVKKTGVNSLGTGLRNIKSRYRLLTNKEVQIMDTDVFAVHLPLIEQVI